MRPFFFGFFSGVAAAGWVLELFWISKASYFAISLSSIFFSFFEVSSFLFTVFDFDGIDFGWHIRKPGARRRFRYDTYSNATVDDALGLMRQLRERGVRSHFWV